MVSEHDIISIWITKRDSFDINCDGITSGAVQIWFQKPEKEQKPSHGYGWKHSDCRFIRADFLGTDIHFPFTKAVWSKISESEIGNNHMWGEDDAHRHLPSSPNHYSNWLAELKIKVAVLSEPTRCTVPIWFTKGNNKDSVSQASTIAGSRVWFLKKPIMYIQISDGDHHFACLEHLASLDELQNVPEELNRSHWDQVDGGYSRAVDYFFKQ